MQMDKRPREEEVTTGDGPELKKPLISPLTKQITAEDLEQFQKEAIYRQMNVYKRERDALQMEINELKKDPNSDLTHIRSQYLEFQRLNERPAADPTNVPATTETTNGIKQETEQESISNEKYNEEIAGYKGTVLSQENQITALQEKVTVLEGKIKQLEVCLEAPSHDVLVRSVEYRQVQKKLEGFLSDNARLEKDLIATQADMVSARQAASQAEFSAQKKVEQKLESLEKKLDSAETDIARLRSDRDDKISEINILKAADASRSQSLAVLKDLQQIAEDRAKPQEADEQLTQKTCEEIDAMDVDALRELAKKLSKKNQILANELPSLEKAYSKAHARATAKMQDQAAVEAKISAANVSKTKADEKFFGAMRAKDAIAAENARLKASLSKCAETISTLRAKEDKVHTKSVALEAKIGSWEVKYQELQRTQLQTDRRRSDAEAQILAIKQEVEALKEKLRGCDAEMAAVQGKLRASQTNVEKLQKQLEIKRAISGSGAVQEQIQSLREMALCSLCTNNWKNTALKCCGHVFCRDCANNRLTSRMRKCPLCNSQFGHNDLLPVHL